MSTTSFIIASVAVIMVFMSGCGHGADRTPTSLTVENKSSSVIFNSYVKVNGVVIGYGLVGATFHATVGFTGKGMSDLRDSSFCLRISDDKRDVLPPWTEYTYELIDPAFPEKEIADAITDIRFVYFEDGSAKVHFLGKGRVLLGELNMSLKGKSTSDSAGKDAEK